MKPFRPSLRQIQKCSADFDEIVVILRHFSSLLSKQTQIISLLAFRNLTDLTGLKKSSIFSILGQLGTANIWLLSYFSRADILNDNEQVIWSV